MSTTLPIEWSVRATRDDWPREFRLIVELFESVYDDSDFDAPRPNYPDYDEPYVCHASTRHPLPHTDDDTEYNWHLLWNPWDSPGSRTAWKFDGTPLLPKQTVHGAPDDVEDPLIARDDDLVEMLAGRAVVCIALTAVGEWHSRGGDWHCDHGFDAVLPTIVAEIEEEQA